MVIMKKFSRITLKDFHSSPIWTWAEDDDEEMVCTLDQDFIPEEHDAVFVLSEFRLHDKTRYEGYVGIRMRDYAVYMIAIADRDDHFISISLHPDLINLIDVKKIEQKLKKRAKDIFPIRYSTIYLAFIESQKSGEIKKPQNTR
jgi:hypothetical protein